VPLIASVTSISSSWIWLTTASTSSSTIPELPTFAQCFTSCATTYTSPRLSTPCA
jgi:hypothetical protein